MSRLSVVMLLATAASISLSGCQQKGEASAPAARIGQSEAEAIVNKTEALWDSGDTAKIMAAYAYGAVMFDPTAPDPSNDRTIQTKWTDAFTAMKLKSHRIPDRRVQAVDADTIIASGTATFEGGTKPVTLRYSDVYQKQADGKWLIVHEHISEVPKGDEAADPKPAA